MEPEVSSKSAQRNYDTLYGYILGNSLGDTGKAAYMIQRLNDLYEVTKTSLDALSALQKATSKLGTVEEGALGAGAGEGWKEHESDER